MKWTRTTSALLIMCSGLMGCASVRNISSPSNTESHTHHQCPIIMQLSPIYEGSVGMFIYREGALWLTPEDMIKDNNPYTDL